MGDREGASRPVAVVTGASQGLGFALAEALARGGWRLVIDARRRGRLEAAAARLAAWTTVVAIPGDIADPAHRALEKTARPSRSRSSTLICAYPADTRTGSPLNAYSAS